MATGIRDTALHSLAAGHERRETPYLDMRYHPSNGPTRKDKRLGAE